MTSKFIQLVEKKYRIIQIISNTVAFIFHIFYIFYFDSASKTDEL
jgi:hypothetical protein